MWHWQNPMPGLEHRNIQGAVMSPAFRAGFLLCDSAHLYYGGLGRARNGGRFLDTVVLTLFSSSPLD
jgi:hypothetical protein